MQQTNQSMDNGTAHKVDSQATPHKHKPTENPSSKHSGKVALYLVILGIAGFLLTAYRMIGACVYQGDEPVSIYVNADDTRDSVLSKLSEAGITTTTFKLATLFFDYKPRTGHYRIDKTISARQLFSKLRNHQQDPLMLRVASVRTLDRLASNLSHQLMLDSASIHEALTDTTLLNEYGYDPQTVYALIIPNTYEVYWDITAADLIKRLDKENKAFWNEERMAASKELNLSPTEVYTLASIIDEETANNGEKPDIAGLYLNRLRIGMPLQADPTVKVAVGDWSLRRIKGEHLRFDSPYNTYLYKGLPPGPLRVASIQGIDAVLHHRHHNYLYMCAKEDFSGTHNFAATFAEHQQNARRYVQALNRRGIH